MGRRTRAACTYPRGQGPQRGLKADTEGGTLVRSSIDEVEIDSDPRKIPGSSWRSAGGGVISLTDGLLYMLDSAYQGASDPEQL